MAPGSPPRLVSVEIHFRAAFRHAADDVFSPDGKEPGVEEPDRFDF